jgi:hypothetical protein
MKKFLTVFFMAALFGAPSFADHHETGHSDADAVVEGDVMVDDEHSHADHHDGEEHDDHSHDEHHDNDDEEHTHD